MGQVFHNLAATLPTDFILKYGGVNLDLLNFSLIQMPNLLENYIFSSYFWDFEPTSFYKFLLRDIVTFYGECNQVNTSKWFTEIRVTALVNCTKSPFADFINTSVMAYPDKWKVINIEWNEG